MIDLDPDVNRSPAKEKKRIFFFVACWVNVWKTIELLIIKFAWSVFWLKVVFDGFSSEKLISYALITFHRHSINNNRETLKNIFATIHNFMHVQM